MRKYIFVFFIFLIPCVGVVAQETLSRKQKRELKNQERIAILENAIKTFDIRIATSKLITRQGNFVSSRGGILYLRPDEAEFMEFFYQDNNDKDSFISTVFVPTEYKVNGRFASGDVSLSFLGNVGEEKWSFFLTIKPSGAHKMNIRTSSGLQLVYEGKAKAL